jgi:hypothetical protein
MNSVGFAFIGGMNSSSSKVFQQLLGKAWEKAAVVHGSRHSRNNGIGLFVNIDANENFFANVG